MKSKKITILVVDESKHDVGKIERTLKKLIPASYEIHLVGNGTDGLAMLTGSNPKSEKLHPDIIVVDIDAPTVKGLEFLRIIKSYIALSTIKVLAISESAGNYALYAARSLGINGHLSRPVTFTKSDGHDVTLLLKTLVSGN